MFQVEFFFVFEFQYIFTADDPFGVMGLGELGDPFFFFGGIRADAVVEVGEDEVVGDIFL